MPLANITETPALPGPGQHRSGGPRAGLATANSCAINIVMNSATVKEYLDRPLGFQR